MVCGFCNGIVNGGIVSVIQRRGLWFLQWNSEWWYCLSDTTPWSVVSDNGIVNGGIVSVIQRRGLSVVSDME